MYLCMYVYFKFVNVYFMDVYMLYVTQILIIRQLLNELMQSTAVHNSTKATPKDIIEAE